MDRKRHLPIFSSSIQAAFILAVKATAFAVCTNRGAENTFRSLSKSSASRDKSLRSNIGLAMLSVLLGVDYGAQRSSG